MSSLRGILLLMLATGCGPAVEVPPELPELASPIPGRPRPPKPEFDFVELAAIDQSGEPIQEVGHQVDFQAKLSYRLRSDSVAIDRLLFRLVAPRDGEDIICDWGYGEVQASTDGDVTATATLTSYPKDGPFAVTASDGPHEIARIPIQIDNESE